MLKDETPRLAVHKKRLSSNLDGYVDPPKFSLYEPDSDLTRIVLSPYSFTYTDTINDLLITRLMAMQKSVEGGGQGDLSRALASMSSLKHDRLDSSSLQTLVNGNKKIMDLLSEPYMDFVARDQLPAHPPSIQRRAVSMTLGPEKAIELTGTDSIFGIPTPLQHLPSKANFGQAILITKLQPPFSVTTINDQACRLFHIANGGDSQETLNLLNFVPECSHEYISAMISAETPNRIKASGLIIEIKDTNELVSIWVEEINADLLVWAFQKVPVHDVLPKDFEARGPCTSYTNLEGEIVLHSTKFEAKPRTIACLVALGRDLVIKNYNHQVFELMLGYSEYDLIGKHVSTLLPQFLEFWPFIERESSIPGVVFPEHLFRKFAGLTPDSPRFLSPICSHDPNISVYALNRFGVKVCVDIQLRVVSKDLMVLWVTYTSQDPVYPDNDGFKTPVAIRTPDLGRSPFKTPGRSPGRSPVPELTFSSAFADSNSLHPSSGSGSSTHVAFNNSLPHHETLETGVYNILESERSENRRRSEASLTWSSSSIAASLRCSPEPNTMSRQELDDIEVGSERRTKKIEQYEVIKNLGHGSYGEVKLVWNRTKKYVIAIKSIYKDRILIDTWSRDRELGVIPNEIKILNQIRRVPHPNIVEFLDFFEDNRCYHMEMVPLSVTNVLDLFDFIELKHSETNEIELLLIWQQIVSAVAHIHSLGIVHRDLKDENVIIDSNRFVKLIDFGSAAYIKQGPFDVFVGTVDYAAPEILLGQPYEGREQDNWALGILLYTIMFRETMFKSPEHIMKAALPQDLNCLGKTLIEKLLTKDPKERATAAEISVEVKKIVHNAIC